MGIKRSNILFTAHSALSSFSGNSRQQGTYFPNRTNFQRWLNINGDEHPALAQAEPQPEPPNIEQALPLPLDGELEVI